MDEENESKERRRKEEGEEKKRTSARVVLIIATGVITCNYRERLAQRSMNAVWWKRKRMQVERRGEPSCPAREEREKEREAVERWIFTRRKSGHALKTMTVGNISSPLTLITGLWLPLLRLPSLPALPATLLFSLRGGVSSLPPVFARLSNPRPRGCLRRYLKLKYMVVQPSRVNFEGAR